MLRCNGLFGLPLSYLVRFGGYKCDEFDAAVYEHVAGVFGKRDAGFGIGCEEDLADDFLHSG